jgi:gas vesicle protein
MQEYKKDIGSKSQAEVNTTQMWFAYLQKVIFFASVFVFTLNISCHADSETLQKLKDAFSKAEQTCQEKYNDTQTLGNNQTIWETPSWWRCKIWYRSDCNKLKQLKFNHQDYVDTMNQLSDYIKTNDNKINSKISTYNNETPNKTLSEMGGEVNSFAMGCKNLSSGIQDKLNTRLQLEKKIMGK